MIGPHHCRRAAAPVQMRDRMGRSKRVGEEVDLARYKIKIALDRSVAVDDGRVATAEPAQRVAEGHVEIKREGKVRWELFQPAPVGRSVNSDVEMRRGRIARISGHACGKQFGAL